MIFFGLNYANKFDIVLANLLASMGYQCFVICVISKKGNHFYLFIISLVIANFKNQNFHNFMID